jgi:hypothetical protein
MKRKNHANKDLLEMAVEKSSSNEWRDINAKMLYEVQTQIMCLQSSAWPCLRQMEKCLLAYTINALVKKRKNDEYICIKI